MSPALYAPIFYNVVLVLVILKCVNILKQNTNNIYRNNKSEMVKAYLLCIAVILFFGMRPVSGAYFGDTAQYAFTYNNYLRYGYLESRDWLWSWILSTCANMGMGLSVWFTLIEFLYVILLLWAAIRIGGNNVIYLLILFFISAFGFWSGAVNGLRIGLATSIFILAFTYLLESGIKKKIFVLLLFIIAISLHKSIALTVLCFFCSIFFFKNIKHPIAFWFISILLLLLFGNFFVSVLDSLGLFEIDQRMALYLTDDLGTDIATDKGGFRADFLLYSFAPIAFGWYITIKKKITDRPYMIMLNTYILANAFWILVMYSNFSNRFASLSWFLYPLLLAYPLIKFKLWNDQHKKLALILFANMFFSYFMWLIK